MRTLDETVAAADLWVELTHEKRAGFARDFAESVLSAGKQTVADPLLMRGRMLRNTGDMLMDAPDHHRRLGMGAVGALAGGGAAGRSTWNAVKKQEGGLSRQQLDIELQNKDEQARISNEGREPTPASIKALERARKLTLCACPVSLRAILNVPRGS